MYPAAGVAPRAPVPNSGDRWPPTSRELVESAQLGPKKTLRIRAAQLPKMRRTPGPVGAPGVSPTALRCSAVDAPVDSGRRAPVKSERRSLTGLAAGDPGFAEQLAMLFLGHPLTPLLDDRTHVFQPLDGYAALLADLACQHACQAGGLEPGRSLPAQTTPSARDEGRTGDRSFHPPAAVGDRRIVSRRR